MKIEEYQRMFELEENYWWFIGKRRIVSYILKGYPLPQSPPRILDVGCGTGANLRILNQLGRAVGIDYSPAALQFCQSRGLSRLSRMIAESQGIKSDQFDIILALDLLEHLANDRMALSEFHRVCVPGGRVLITVPAHPSLWSEHDEALEHKRRYTKSDLRKKIEEAGFKILLLSYYNAFLYLPIVLIRFLQSRFKSRHDHPETTYLELPQILNQTLAIIFGLEGRILKYTNLPWGLSLICVAQKVTAHLEPAEGEKEKELPINPLP
ncbi:MAG: methyltransferase domain-containing protein [bacterium]